MGKKGIYGDYKEIMEKHGSYYLIIGICWG